MDEIDELLEEQELNESIIIRKKHGRRTTGKYKCRGKHIAKDVY